MNDPKWFYKPIEFLVTNFAVVSQDDPCLIRFVDQAGYVFDRIRFPKGTSLGKVLKRNGFKVAKEDDTFVKLIGLPSEITDTGWNRQPVYSSGEYWND